MKNYKFKATFENQRYYDPRMYTFTIRAEDYLKAWKRAAEYAFAYLNELDHYFYISKIENIFIE